MDKRWVAIVVFSLSCGPAGAVDGGGPSPGLDPAGGTDGAAAADGAVTVRRTNVGGSRLKAAVVRGADGSKAYTGMHDAQLDIDCYFGAASDGKLRCLPSSYATIPGSYYVDAGCSQLAAISNNCAPVVKYGAGSACGAGGDVRNVTLAGQTVVYTKTGVTCTMLDLSTSYRVYAVGSVVPPATFLEGTQAYE